MDVTWNDDYNTPFDGTLTPNPASGDKNKTVSVSDGVNEGLDRKTTIVVESTASSSLKKEVVVRQKGKRVPFCTSDGTAFMVGGTFNVLK